MCHAAGLLQLWCELMQLSSSEVRPYLSPYLMGGWRQDEFELDSAVVEECSIRGQIRVKRFFEPGDGEFHLALPAAFIWIAQLAIIHGCWVHRLPRKSSEIYIRDIQLKCRRPIRSMPVIEFALTEIACKPVQGGSFHSGRIAIDRDAFVGRGRFVFPLAANETGASMSFPGGEALNGD